MNQNTLIAATSIANAIINSCDSQKTAGKVWPNDATHCLISRLSSWPIGWDRDLTVNFYTSEQELLEQVERYTEWALYEDNYVAYQAYYWDWGPQVMVHARNNAQL